MKTLPAPLQSALARADSSWFKVLERGLAAIEKTFPGYLSELASSDYLPTSERIFSAFVQPLPAVRHILIGEGPYPRAESATGFCFMDGAVNNLWSPAGLSKQVNRATSLRNFIKMLLVAEGVLDENETSGKAVAEVAAQALAPGALFIQTLPELQANMLDQGFLLLNASLVYRPQVPALTDARAWRPFLETVLAALSDHGREPPTLLLWGRIAEPLAAIDATRRLRAVEAEHPYNLSFIRNRTMQAIFRPMHLLVRRI